MKKIIVLTLTIILVSLISLFDVVSILDGGNAWVYKLIILVIVGLAGYIIGSIRFEKKDLPL